MGLASFLLKPVVGELYPPGLLRSGKEAALAAETIGEGWYDPTHPTPRSRRCPYCKGATLLWPPQPRSALPPGAGQSPELGAGRRRLTRPRTCPLPRDSPPRAPQRVAAAPRHLLAGRRGPPAPLAAPRQRPPGAGGGGPERLPFSLPFLFPSLLFPFPFLFPSPPFLFLFPSPFPSFPFPFSQGCGTPREQPSGSLRASLRAAR